MIFFSYIQASEIDNDKSKENRRISFVEFPEEPFTPFPEEKSNIYIDFFPMLIGNAKIGKTQLYRKLMNHDFNERYKPTIGADLNHKYISFQDPMCKNNRIKCYVRLWDTAGEERFHHLAIPFISRSNSLLFCYSRAQKDTTNGLHPIDQLRKTWLKKTISHHTLKEKKSVPIFLIGLKNDISDIPDEENEVKNFKEEVEQYAFLKWGGHYKISSKEDTNLEKILKKMACFIIKGYCMNSDQKDVQGATDIASESHSIASQSSSVSSQVGPRTHEHNEGQWRQRSMHSLQEIEDEEESDIDVMESNTTTGGASMLAITIGLSFFCTLALVLFTIDHKKRDKAKSKKIVINGNRFTLIT